MIKQSLRYILLINTKMHAVVFKGGMLLFDYCSYYLSNWITTTPADSSNIATQSPITVNVTTNINATHFTSKTGDIEIITEDYEGDPKKVIRKKENGLIEEPIRSETEENEGEGEDEEYIIPEKKDGDKEPNVDIPIKVVEPKIIETKPQTKMITGTPNVVRKKKFVNM